MNFILINADPATLESVRNKDPAGADMPKALYLRGEQCYDGQGVPRDLAKAHRFYRIAAGMGNAEAQYKIGLLYARGQGVQQNRVLAAKWTRRAAEQGLARAQDSLGAMYFNGYGVPLDVAKAQEWYQKAADQGFLPQSKVLNYLRKEYHLVLVGGVHRDDPENLYFAFILGNNLFISRFGDEFILNEDWGREGIHNINTSKSLDDAFLSSLFYHLNWDIAKKARSGEKSKNEIGINQLKDNGICVFPYKERFEVGICINRKYYPINRYCKSYEDAVESAEILQKKVDMINEVLDELVSKGVIEENGREDQLKTALSGAEIIKKFDP